jgi:hypothetical protein
MPSTGSFPLLARYLADLGVSANVRFAPDSVLQFRGLGVKLSNDILARPSVLSAVGVSPPQDGVR